MERKEPVILLRIDDTTTIQFFDENGCAAGEVLLPGIDASFQAFSDQTGLPHFALEPIHGLIGRNTFDALSGGLLYGHAGMIDGILERMEPAKTLVSGRFAALLKPYLRHEVELSKEDAYDSHD